MKELKSFLSLNLAIIMLLTMLFPVPAIAVNSDVPESAIEETVTATEGSEPIVDRDFNNGKMHYTISADGVLTITGTGAMQNYSSADHAPWYTYRAQVKKIVVEDGITTIGEYAFAEMNAVTSVTLPEGIEEIPLYAFYNCSALRTIDLPVVGKTVLADTVGFIRHLPHDLVAAFKGTLEETAQADCSAAWLARA